MKNRNILIQHPSQLNALTSFPFLRTRGRGKISLPESIQHPDKEKWEKDINKNYYACGCDTGAKGLMLFLVAGLIYSIYGNITTDISIITSVLQVVLFAVGGAIVGKVVGLWRADNRLKKTVHTVQAHWELKLKPEKQIYTCG